MTTPPVLEFAERLQAVFGGPIKRLRKEYRVLCPVHESDGTHHHPSLALWQRPHGGIALCCMTGCKHSDIVAKIVSRNVTMPFSRFSSENEDDASEGIRRARAIVESSSEIVEGDVVDRYLRSRAIEFRRDEMRCLRIAPGKYQGSWHFVQIMVDPDTLDSEDWRAVGVQLTFLNSHGNALRSNMTGRTLRKVLGKRKGCGVVIGTPSRHVVIGEGVESTWSAMRLLDRSFGIATLGAMTDLNMPSLVNEVTIAADNDRAGIARATALAAMWGLSGYKVHTMICGDENSKTDANDALVARNRS